MIYTFTLNPALDRFIVVDRLLMDDTTRVLSETHYAAGKGIDVSRAIRELGGQSVAMGLVGGYDGLELEGLLINAGVACQFTKISGETRTNIILKEKASGHQYVISASGPEIGAAEIGGFFQGIPEIKGADYLVMSGSLPRGVTPNLYAQLILVGRGKGAFVLLDADGDALRAALAYQPTAIKPNLFELSRLIGKEIKNEGEIITACDEIHEQGVIYILVSMGKEGLILSTREQKIKAVPPPVEVASTVGAGDSTVAGFVLAHSQGKDLSECARIGCAAGAAAVITPGTELCHRNDMEEILPRVKTS
ncbi:MAG: 1-phosphofructokinase, partial [Pseudomonadota bacterium]